MPEGREVRMGHACWNLQAQTLSERVMAIGGLGFRAISFCPTPLKMERGEEDGEVQRLVGLFDMRTTCHTKVGGTEDLARLSQLQDEVSDIAKWHEATGRVDVVSFDAGTRPAPQGRVHDLEGTLQKISYAMDILRPLGISVAIENWLWNVRLEDLDEMASALPGLQMLLDVGHLLLARSRGLLDGMPMDEYLGQIPMKVPELHLHDNDGFIDAHAPLGTGILDLCELARGLHAIRFAGIATIEHGGPLNQATLGQIAESAGRFSESLLGSKGPKA